jgi:hypothetical protein
MARTHYLDAPVPRGFYGRGRPKSEGRRCLCGRILIPTRNNLWPFHFANPDLKRWCKRSDQAVTS